MKTVDSYWIKRKLNRKLSFLQLFLRLVLLKLGKKNKNKTENHIKLNHSEFNHSDIQSSNNVNGLWRRHSLPSHNSCCLPWWGCDLWGKYTPPTSRSPVQLGRRGHLWNASQLANLRPRLKTNPQSRTYVVGGPPGFELEVPLQSGSQVFLKVLR